MKKQPTQSGIIMNRLFNKYHLFQTMVMAKWEAYNR